MRPEGFRSIWDMAASTYRVITLVAFTFVALTVVADVCADSHPVVGLGEGRAAPGQIDPSFGNQGLTVTHVADGSDVVFDLLVQPDGKIIAAGDATPYPNREFALARYNPDGSLDPGFGTGGYVTTDFGGGDSGGRAVVRQPDGKLVVAGRAAFGEVSSFAVARYDTSGTLDPAFGTAGLVVTSFPGGSALAMVLQPDGKLVVAGGAGGRFALARYEANGTLDPAFGTAGLVTTDLGGVADRVQALVLQPDGKLVAGGRTGTLYVSDFALMRYDANGSLDASFGTGGIVITDVGPGNDQVMSLALQLDGKLVAGGSRGGASSFVLARYEADGSLDTSFGAGGLAEIPGGGPQAVSALALAPDGRIVSAGSRVSPTEGSVFALSRHNPDGSVDTSFGTLGIAVADFGAGPEAASALVLQADGAIVAAGRADPFDYNDDFALTRFEGGSTLDCAYLPLASCRVPTAPGKAKLILKDHAQPDRAKLIWKWGKGEATTTGDFGNPTATNDLVVCLYDESGGSPTLRMRLSAPSGGRCAGRPCWKASSRGFKYRDKTRQPEGLDKLALKAGDDGKAKIGAVAKGGTVPTVTASLPLALPVRVQLQAVGGECWEATYSVAGMQRNTVSQFKGKSD